MSKILDKSLDEIRVSSLEEISRAKAYAKSVEFRTIYKTAIMHDDIETNEVLEKFGFTKLYSSSSRMAIWVNPKHWQLTTTEECDYRVGDFKFKALTKEAKNWANKFPMQAAK